MRVLRFRNPLFEALPDELATSDFQHTLVITLVSIHVTKNQKNSSRIRILGSNGLIKHQLITAVVTHQQDLVNHKNPWYFILFRELRSNLSVAANSGLYSCLQIPLRTPE